MELDIPQAKLMKSRPKPAHDEICPEMHALAKMAEMVNNRQIVKIFNKMAKGPFGKWRFGENGVIGENGRNPENAKQSIKC